MTHLEHNEENFTFLISENKWIMKNKLFLNNFIYFNSQKFNLTSKVGLWMNAKTDVCGRFSKLYHHVSS